MANIFDETLEVNNNIFLTQFPGTNNTGDNDSKRESIIQFKGFDSNIQEGVLASITASHSGSVTDHKGKIKFNINDGSSNNNLHNIMTIGPAEIKNSGALQASTNSPATITLASTASSTDDFYNNYNLKIISGNGIGQLRKIIDYVGSSKIATLESNWTTIPIANDNYEILSSSVSIIGDLNVSSIISSTNTTIKDNMIELNTGAASNTHDSGILIERGTTGDNAFMGWDESEDRFILGTTTAINTDTGDLTISPSPLEISNLFLKTNSSTINFGANSDVSLTHVPNTGLVLNSTTTNTDLTIKSSNTSDGEAHLTMISDNGENVGDGFQIKTINGQLTFASDHNLSGTYGETILTLTGHDTDNSRAVAITGTLDVTGDTSVSTFDSSGATSLATGGGAVNIASTGLMTTIKGTLNVDEAVTLDTTLDVTGDTSVSTFDSSGATSLATGGGAVDIASTGLMTTIKGTLNVDEAVTLDNNLSLVSDGVVLNFGVNNDVNLSHVHDTGILLNTDKQLQFRDSDIYINSNSDGNMTLNADTGINLNINNDNKVNITTTTTTFGTNITTSGITATGTLNTAILNTSGEVTFTGNGASITGGTGLNIFLGNIPTGLGSATNNVGLGVGSLNGITGTDNTVGIQNTAIGYNSGNSITTGTNNTCIGYEADTTSSTIQNEFTLGNGSITTLRCANQTIASLSDGRDKTNIVDSTYGLDFINTLRPIQFTWNKRVLVNGDETFSKNGKDELGFIAQDFQKVMPNNENDILDLVHDSNPDRLEARYGKLIPILTKAIQDLSGIVKELNEKIKKLESSP